VQKIRARAVGIVAALKSSGFLSEERGDYFIFAYEINGVEFFGAPAQLELGTVGGISEGVKIDAPEGLVAGGFDGFYFW